MPKYGYPVFLIYQGHTFNTMHKLNNFKTPLAIIIQQNNTYVRF